MQADNAATGLRPGWSGDGYYTSIRHLACGECLTLFAPGLSHEKWVEEFERMQADHEEKCDLSNNEGPPERAFSPNRRDQQSRSLQVPGNQPGQLLP